MLKLMGFSWAILWRFMILVSFEVVAALQIAINFEAEDPFGVLVGDSIINAAISVCLIFVGMFLACLWASKTSGPFKRFVLSYVEKQ